MYITFENEAGSIQMTGGGNSTWRIIAAEGFDIAQYDTQAAYIKGKEGRTVSTLQSLERSITLKGDIITKNSTLLLTKAAQILDKKGKLKITQGSKKRMIEARCTAFVTEKERGGIRPFVIQFVCDDPFFTDFAEQSADISTIEKLLYGTLDLSEEICFSIGRTKLIINNRGVKNAEPVVIISSASAMQGQVITLSNSVTGQSITINYILTPEDELVIDIPKREIRLNGERRFDLLAANSFLSDFYMIPDENEIAVETNNNSDRLTASIKYFNKYNEAMG